MIRIASLDPVFVRNTLLIGFKIKNRHRMGASDYCLGGEKYDK